VAVRLRRARVVGRSFSANALKHAYTAGACSKKTRRGPSAALLGALVWRNACGDGAHYPSGRHGAKYINLNHHVGFESFSKISNFRGLGSSRKGAARHQAPPVTKSHNSTFSPTAKSAESPCDSAAFLVYQSPTPGHVPRFACVWGKKTCEDADDGAPTPEATPRLYAAGAVGVTTAKTCACAAKFRPSLSSSKVHRREKNRASEQMKLVKFTRFFC
jgi:hypothetical protein